MQPTFDFLSDGGEMGALMREHDWAATPLGPPHEWPETLKTSVRLVLTSHHPMFIWWGPELIQFYNDAYRQTLGPERHPSALGQPGRECWLEIWDIIGPQIESVMAGGEATWHEDQLVPVTRNGQRENVWWTYGYSPIQDGVGVRGVLVVCSDVTAEHRSRQAQHRLNRQLVDEIHRREKVEQHLAFQLELSDELRGLTEPLEIATTAFALLGRYLSVSRISYVEIDEENNTFRISHEWKRSDLSSMAGFSGVLGNLGPEILATLRKGQIVRVSDIASDTRTASHVQAYAAIDARAVLFVPLTKDGKFVASMNLQQPAPYEWTASQIALVEDIGQRIWNAIEHARADTLRLRAANALAHRRAAETERLRSLFRQAPGFMAVLQGPTHIFEFCNAAYLRLVGQRSLLDRPIREALPEIEGQGFYELLDQVFQTAKPFSATDVSLIIQRQRGAPATQAYVDFVYQPIIDVDGSVTGIFVEGFDATERRLAKLALEASEERLKEGMAAARMAIWEWTLATGNVTFSDNAPVVFGRSWTDITNARTPIHKDDLQRLLDASAKAIATRSSYEEVVRYTRPDNGALMWLQIYGKVVCGDDGEPFAVRGVSIDVTERKRAEEALREADRRKDEFLAMLAHELRNPLAPIGTAAQILSIAGHNEARVRQTSEIIRRQVEHMTSLINDMLDVSRVTSGLVTLDKEPLDINQIVAESIEQVRPFIEARGHYFTSSPRIEAAAVLGDRKRLVQVITNLLQNAAKYTPENGIIALAVELREGEIVISVSDNGVGIDAQLLPYIFELFTQGERSSDRSQGGLGLGLSLVKTLVSLHGGRVQASSPGSGQGATFTVYVPQWVQASETVPSQDNRAAFSYPACNPLRVLVVDDNADAAQTMAILLESAGHRATIEHRSEAALERAKQDKPDVILLDIGLSGMDGNELARQLRSRPETADATLIAITGYGQERDRETSLAAGFDHFFVKPADPHKLMMLLTDISSSHR